MKSIKKQKIAIAVHGGAGNISKENMTPSLEHAYKKVLEKAAVFSHQILQEGNSSLQAVQKAVNILEDSPLFNAGKGAVLAHDGTIQLDASVMLGKTLQAGAVANVQRIKNPIDLAIQVMLHSPHVLLSEKGAEEFAIEQGFSFVDPQYFVTKKRLADLHKAKNQSTQTDLPLGTVGAVALDKDGNLAAATSTGGMTNKKHNRIGDTAIIGAGTYANNTTCAVSGTGWGEFFIRTVAAHDVSALMQYQNLSLNEAIAQVLQKISTLGGFGGIIGVDKLGHISMDFHCTGMYRAAIDINENLEVAIF